MSKRIIKGATAQRGMAVTVQSKSKSRIIPQDMIKMTGPEIYTTKYPIHTAPRQQHQAPADHAQAKSVHAQPKSIPTTAMGINQLVESKVREFEERFQFEKEQALSQGISQGEARGIKEGLKGVERIERLFDNILKEFQTEKENFYIEAEAGVAKLALEIAEAIIGEAAANSSEDVLHHNLKRCLNSLKTSGKIKIRISPLDYDYARTNTQLINQAASENCSLEFEPDPSIAPGGCYLETISGAIDGRLESQFDIIKDNFLQIA